MTDRATWAVTFELQFLPYHNEPITQWQRIAVLLDLILIWVFWRRIALPGEVDRDHPGWRARLMPWLQKTATLAVMLALTGVSVVMMFVIATFPGETLEKRYADLGDFPFRQTLKRLRIALVAGDVQPVSRSLESLWSNRLVLPGLDLVVHLKLDSEDKIKFLPETVSLRGRDLSEAVLIGAVLRKADFTGARMGGAKLGGADLRGAKMSCAEPLSVRNTIVWEMRPDRCTDLQGASLHGAQLQGASLDGADLEGASLNNAQLQGASLKRAELQDAWLDDAQLQGASLDGADLEGASLNNAQLQGASLTGARLPGASLDKAQLQGASLNFVQLLGASLVGAQLQGASLKSVFIWRADAVTADATNAWMEPVAKYRSAPCNNPGTNNICDWTKADFDKLIFVMEKSVFNKMRARDVGLKRLDPRLNPDTDQPPANEGVVGAWWKERNMPRSAVSDFAAERAKHWQAAGCSAAGAPHVAAQLT